MLLIKHVIGDLLDAWHCCHGLYTLEVPRNLPTESDAAHGLVHIAIVNLFYVPDLEPTRPVAEMREVVAGCLAKGIHGAYAQVAAERHNAWRRVDVHEVVEVSIC